MIERTLAGTTNTSIVVYDGLGAEDDAGAQALLARSSESIGVAVGQVYARRREAFRGALTALAKTDGLGEPGENFVPEAVLDTLMDVSVGGDLTGAKIARVLSSWMVGYAHKSIADCGSATAVFRNVSMIAAKAIQDNPLYSGTEMSTRAVDMTKQPIVDPVGSIASKAILDRWMAFYADSQGVVAAEVTRRHPMSADENPKTYANAVKMRTLDILRGFLPAGICTQLSWHSNLRQFGDKLDWLTKHPSDEVATLADNARQVLHERYPSSGFASHVAGVSGVTGGEQERQDWMRKVAAEHTYGMKIGKCCSPFHTTVDNGDLRRYADFFASRPRGQVLPHFVSELGQISCRLKLDFGSWRDIQRQRNGVCRMPLLTTSVGFEPWYLEQLPDSLREEAYRLIDEQTIAIRRASDDPVASQYLIPMGFLVDASVTYPLPSFVYVAELRASKTVHPTLRAVIQEMVTKFQLAHPMVKLHVDMDPDSWTVRRGAQTIERKL